MATSGLKLDRNKKRKYAYKKKTKHFRGSKERLQTKLNIVDTEKGELTCCIVDLMKENEALKV